MSADVLLKLVAVFAVIALGYAAGRTRLVGPTAGDTLSAATFNLFAPALLFRTMASVSLVALPWRMVLAYFVPTVLLLLTVYGWQRRRGLPPPGPAVRALAVTFSNTLQLGVPVVTALYGTAGLTLHVAIVSLHALVLLTLATVLAERDRGGSGSRVGQTVRRSLIHPVTLPILAGLAYHVTGLPLPSPVDDVLVTLGAAVVPLSLVAIGLSLRQYGIRGGVRAAAALSAGKLIAHPLLVLAATRLAGLHGLPMTVAVLAAALPTGANVLLFAGRYRSRQAETAATTVLSTVAYAVTVTAWLFLLG